MADATTDFSCGVIPWRLTPGGEREYLLIQHNAGHWSFPKGHPEAGEDDLVAARRELAEETGIEAVELLRRLPSTSTTAFKTPRGHSSRRRFATSLGRFQPNTARSSCRWKKYRQRHGEYWRPPRSASPSPRVAGFYSEPRTTSILR
jgi:8-oxo-dGTP pyrophosphatase MutT (NUDIX family)